MNDEVKKQFILFLKKIHREKVKNFSGLGFILYDSKSFPKKYYSDLRTSAKFPKNTKINDPTLIKFFSETSDSHHSLHEGYHFFNEKGQLTHVCQCFLPPVIRDIKPNEFHGVRHLSAQYGLHVKGVIAIGVISGNRKAYYFTKGKYCKL